MLTGSTTELPSLMARHGRIGGDGGLLPGDDFSTLRRETNGSQRESSQSENDTQGTGSLFLVLSVDFLDASGPVVEDRSDWVNETRTGMGRAWKMR